MPSASAAVVARVRCCCDLALWVSFTLWLAAQRTGVVRLYLGIVRKAQEFVSGSGSGAVSSVVNLYFPTGNNDKKLTYVNCTLTPEDEVETWGDLLDCFLNSDDTRTVERMIPPKGSRSLYARVGDRVLPVNVDDPIKDVWFSRKGRRCPAIACETLETKKVRIVW